MAIDRADVLETQFLEQHSAVHSAMQARFDRVFDARQKSLHRIADNRQFVEKAGDSCFSPA